MPDPIVWDPIHRQTTNRVLELRRCPARHPFQDLPAVITPPSGWAYQNGLWTKAAATRGSACSNALKNCYCQSVVAERPWRSADGSLSSSESSTRVNKISDLMQSYWDCRRRDLARLLAGGKRIAGLQHATERREPPPTGLGRRRGRRQVSPRGRGRILRNIGILLRPGTSVPRPRALVDGERPMLDRLHRRQ